MKIMALVPARGGSCRVPGKNLRLLGGKPLIVHTLEAARRSRRIQRLLVSTDSPEIAAVARQHGAEVPFLRPPEISGPLATEREFLTHALDWLRDHEAYEPDLLVWLYPTSPFRRPESIDRAIEEMKRHPGADSLRSLVPCSEHPCKMWEIREGRAAPFLKLGDRNLPAAPYQSLPPVYIQNASIYITRPATLREKGSPIGEVVLPFVMEAREAVDINTPIDFKLAELLLEDESLR